MDSVVSVRDVSKQYRRAEQSVTALEGCSLDVAAGEFLAIMGPSGSGKSTLLNLLCGLDRPSCGQIRVAGAQLDRLSGSELSRWRARHIGYIFQFYNLMPHLTAARNVELPLLLTTLSGKERKGKSLAALDLVGLADRRSHKPSQLSGGQQQRVAIARAIVADPAVLICDEPTGDLDRTMAEQILDLLRLLNTQHRKTIIMVTHDPKAAGYASRQVRVDKGRIVPLQHGAIA